MTTDGYHGARDYLWGADLAAVAANVAMLRAWLTRWRADHAARTIARHRAIRHLAVVARAVYIGSTAAYELMPDLPRYQDSSNVDYNYGHKPV